MRRCSSMGDVRLRARGQASRNASRGCGAEPTGTRHGLSLRPSWSPMRAAKGWKTGSGVSFGSSGRSYLSANSPSVSPWCRQSSSPTEWGGPAGEVLDGQG